MNLEGSLSWDGHLTTGKKSVLPIGRKQLGSLYKLKDSLSFKARLHPVNSLILSRLTYGICLWGHTITNHIRKAQILLNQAGRFVTGEGRMTSSSSLMRQCGWMNISTLTEYYSLMQIYKTVRWNTPALIRDRMDINEDLLILTGAPRLLLTANSYRYKAVGYWNSLPLDMRQETKIGRFKCSLKKWLLDRQNSGNAPQVGPQA